jgi:hypothetical protein
MGILIVPVDETDHQGYTLATQVLWAAHGSPKDSLLIIAPEVEDFALALATARHWGALIQKRSSRAALWATQNGDPVSPKIAEQMKDHRPVIVASRLDRHNLDQVTKIATILGQASKTTVIVGALVDEAGKHKGLVVRTPSGA